MSWKVLRRAAASGLLLVSVAVAPGGRTPVAGAEPSPVSAAAAGGDVLAFGAAPKLGSLVGRNVTQPVVGIAGTPSGQGYWLVASDGGIFAFGDAAFHGSTGSVRFGGADCGDGGDAVGAGVLVGGFGWRDLQLR